MRKIYVLDTSVLLSDPKAYKVYKDSDVVIPISVIDELDKKKTYYGESGKNARICIRKLDEISDLGDISVGILLDDDIMIKIDTENRNLSGYGDPKYADTAILVCAYEYLSYYTHTNMYMLPLNAYAHPVFFYLHLHYPGRPAATTGRTSRDTLQIVVRSIDVGQYQMFFQHIPAQQDRLTYSYTRLSNILQNCGHITLYHSSEHLLNDPPSSRNLHIPYPTFYQ